VRMEKVKKFTGVYKHTAKDGTTTYHIRGKIKGLNYTEVVGSTAEGVTAQFASNMRAKKHGAIKLGEDSPLHTPVVYSLDEAAELYFNNIEHKSNTDNARAVYIKHLQPVFGTSILEQVTSNSIDLFKRAKLKEKIVREVRGKKLPINKTYSQATVNKLIDLISAIYNYMSKKHGVKTANPCKEVERFKVDNRRERYLESEEVGELLHEIRTNPKLRKREMLELFTMLALTTGARLSGILNISKGDVNLNNGQITIKDFKRDMTYVAHIHNDVRPLLVEAHSRLKQTEYIIGGRNKQMHKDSMAKMLQPLLNKLFNTGLDKTDAKRRTVIHTLRHTFASQLAISGVPIFTIQKLLNHKEIEQTMRYAKLMPNQGATDVQNIKLH